MLSNYDSYKSILPPHWCKEGEVYINELTLERTNEPPINKYISNRNLFISNEDTPNLLTLNITQPTQNVFIAEDENKNTVSELVKRQKYYEFHCQWSEHDLFGKINLFGLIIRYYEDHHTVVKFDGLEGEWINTKISSPYGLLEQYDLFIGAKVILFGRHLTISSASVRSVKWIETQRKKLLNQQNLFREKITGVGKIPIVKQADINVVRNITRGDVNPPGHIDLRRLLNENARLGEQIVSLGLTLQL